jgi:uncharacterized protein (TIRG00374 family)
MSARPTWAKWVTRISLVIGIVALVFTIRNLGLDTIGTYFRRIGWWWFGVIALEVTVTSMDAIAIRCFLSPESDKVRLRSTLLAQLAGRSINAVTPSGNLGEVVKSSVLTEHVSQSRAVATILLYNVVSFSVELLVVAVAAPFLALLVPMPSGLTWLFLIAGFACLVLSIGIYALVRRGMLSSIARTALRLRLISKARHARWQDKLRAVDDKVRLVAGARTRDRVLGIGLVTLSRLTSMTLSLMIFHAIGGELTVGFIAGYTVGGFVVYMVATLVPMGLGISEGGYAGLFKALGEDPAKGATLVLARRVTLALYAATGLVLMTVSETVKRARARQRTARAAEQKLPVTVPESGV